MSKRILSLTSQVTRKHYTSNPIWEVRIEFQYRIPEPHSRHPNPQFFKSYPQNLDKPGPNPQWINVLYQEHIQYKMLIHRKSQYFQVNIPWVEPQSYSWSTAYCTCPLVFASFTAPGKFQENVLQTYSYITCLHALYYIPCVLFSPSIVSIHHPHVDWRTSGSVVPINDSRLT